jgi:hypothetical protein
MLNQSNCSAVCGNDVNVRYRTVVFYKNIDYADTQKPELEMENP